MYLILIWNFQLLETNLELRGKLDNIILNKNKTKNQNILYFHLLAETERDMALKDLKHKEIQFNQAVL